MQNGAATLEDSLTVSYKAKHTLSIQPKITLLGIYPKELKTYIYTKNLYTAIYSNFIHNCQNVDANRCPSVGKWINKLWSIQTMEYYSTLNRNEQLNHERHG